MSKVIQIFAKDVILSDGTVRAEKLLTLDDEGVIREHFSDDPPDLWRVVPHSSTPTNSKKQP